VGKFSVVDRSIEIRCLIGTVSESDAQLGTGFILGEGRGLTRIGTRFSGRETPAMTCLLVLGQGVGEADDGTSTVVLGCTPWTA
jgi:hypothetical protein